ncbi:MAG: dipeptidase [Halolamina sp.]
MIPVVDGHNDVLLRADADAQQFLDGSDGDVENESHSDAADADGHLDLQRARRGGLAAGFFAAFVPSDTAPTNRWRRDADAFPDDYAPAVRQGPAAERALRMFARLKEWADGTDGFRVVGDAADLDACLAGDAVGAVPHLEGAAAVEPDRSNLDDLVEAGVRSIGLTWSRPNAFGCGVPFAHEATPDIGPGLTTAGEELVAACEDRGLLVDCAHLNAAGLRDVLGVIDAPPVVSHTAANALCPHARNLTDDQLRAVGDAGGVVGVTFAAGHLRPDGEADPDTPLSVLVDHVAHVAEVAGVDGVALGSDFDGATVIDPVAGADRLPRLLDALADAGFDDAERRKIAAENWRRVCRAWW